MKTIIFDFDGTMADSFAVIVSIIGRITGRGSFEEKELNDFKERTLIEIAKRLEITKLKWPFLVAAGRKEMSKNLDKLELHEGIENIIKKLSKEKLNLVILSSNSKKNIDKILEKFKLSEYFNHVEGNVGLLSKSRAIQSFLKKEEINHNDVIYIGDEARDAIAASKVGIKFIGVSWGFNSRKMLAKYPNYALVDNTSELDQNLQNWIKA